VEEPEIDLTPMLDVVFIMLIFFIVTATFVKETGLDASRPDNATQTVEDKKNIVVSIGANNQIWVNGREIDRRALRANIEKLYAENPQASVVISPSGAADNEFLVLAVDQARAAGVLNVSISDTTD